MIVLGIKLVRLGGVKKRVSCGICFGNVYYDWVWLLYFIYWNFEFKDMWICCCNVIDRGFF